MQETSSLAPAPQKQKPLHWRIAASLLVILVVWFNFPDLLPDDRDMSIRAKVLFSLRACMMAFVPLLAQLIYIPLLLAIQATDMPRNKPLHQTGIDAAVSGLKESACEFGLFSINLLCMSGIGDHGGRFKH